MFHKHFFIALQKYQEICKVIEKQFTLWYQEIIPIRISLVKNICPVEFYPSSRKDQKLK